MRTFYALLACLALAACGKDEPKSTRWDNAAASAAAAPAASGAPKKEAGSFNRFFPKDGADNAKVAFTADKEGYAEAKVSVDGADVATLTVADSINDADAKKKFESASERLDGNPLVTTGKTQSAVLVNNRYQVKVSSKTLDADARKKWLGRFDLAGIASL